MKFRLDLKAGDVSWLPLAKEKAKTLKPLLWLWGVVGLFSALVGVAMVGLG